MHGLGGLGPATGDDDALESFLDNYLTNSFGTAGGSGFGMSVQQPQPQQVTQQTLLGSGLVGQPQMHATLVRPASVGQAPISGSIHGLNGMGFPSSDDTANMSIPALQALLRQRQLQQQQAGFGGVTSTQFGQMSGIVAMGNPGLVRPTSLQDRMSAGMSTDHNAWRPSLGPVPTATGMQPFNTALGGQFGGGAPMQGFQEAAFPNLLAPAPMMRPASDSLLANQKGGVATPIGVQGHGLSSLRANSLSAQNAAAATGGGGAFNVGQMGATLSKKSLWDASTPPVAEGSDDSSEDDSSQRRRVKGRSASTSHQPSVQQEKNRSAQRRFRQRQKEKMAYLETRTETLAVQVEKLSSENESLRNMNIMLEKVLNLREEHISNLQEAAKVFSNLNLRNDAEGSGSGENVRGDAAAKTVNDMVATAAAGGDGGGGSDFMAGGGGGPLAIKSEDSAAAATAAGGGMSTDVTVAASSPMGLLGGGHVLPQNIDGATARFTAEAIRSMSADDVIEAWKENLKELSRYVVLAENAPPGQLLPPPVLARITSVTASMSELVHKVAMISPLNVKRLLATNMELHAMVPVPESHWARVLLVLGLSERQRKDLLGARERFLAKFEALVQERAALINNLSQQATPRSRVYADICSASLAAHEAADRLRANLQREHNINMEFVVFVFRGVLDLLQVAKAAVHSYPYYPDVLAISNVLHAQTQQGLGQGQGQNPGQNNNNSNNIISSSNNQNNSSNVNINNMQSSHCVSQQSSLLSHSSPQTQAALQMPSLQLQQQQQQQLLMMMSSQSQQQQQSQCSGDGLAMGGLRTSGRAPVGAAALYGARVTTSLSPGLSGAGTGLGGSGGGIPASGAGVGSTGNGSTGIGGGMSGLHSLNGINGLNDSGIGASGMGGGGGMGLGMGVGFSGGPASSLGGGGGGLQAAGGLQGFQPQQPQKPQHQQQSQQQQLLQPLGDSKMTDG